MKNCFETEYLYLKSSVITLLTFSISNGSFISFLSEITKLNVLRKADKSYALKKTKHTVDAQY